VRMFVCSGGVSSSVSSANSSSSSSSDSSTQRGVRTLYMYERLVQYNGSSRTLRNRVQPCCWTKH
jgi:hypothetical protein